MDLGVTAGTAVYAAFAGHVTKFQAHIPANDTSKVYGAQLFMRSHNDMVGAFYPLHRFKYQSWPADRDGRLFGNNAPRAPPHGARRDYRGCPNRRYMGVDIYRDFVALRDTSNIISVTFHQNGHPPSVSY